MEVGLITTGKLQILRSLSIGRFLFELVYIAAHFRTVSQSWTASAPPLPSSTPPPLIPIQAQPPQNDPRLPLLLLPSYEEAIDME